MIIPAENSVVQHASPESAKSMFSFFGKISRLRKFWETRCRIRNGEALFDWTAEELQKAELMGPWTLNIYECVLVALPSVVIFGIANFFMPPTEQSMDVPEVVAEGIRLGDKLFTFAHPLFIPVLFMLGAWVTSWVSFRHGDRSPSNRKRAKYAYLYYDGAYGLFPETLLVFGISLLTFVNSHKFQGPTKVSIYLTLIIALPVAGLWNRDIVFKKIPCLLFGLNGYSSKPPAPITLFRRRPRIPNLGPWFRYQLGVFLCGWGGTFLVFVLAMICMRIGIAAARLKEAIGS